MDIFDWLFVGEYVKCGDERLAFVNAGGNPKFARRDGGRMMEKQEIKDELRSIGMKLQERYNIDLNIVMSDIAAVLSADPRDIVSVHRLNCRNCYGVDHRYQWTKDEMNKAQIAHAFGHPPPDVTGGAGFDEFADPHPDCPECGGLGVERVVIKDTRDLTVAQASLIQSVEQTKNGIKITMRSKDSARDAAARMLGLDKSTLNLNVGNKKLEEMSDDELMMLARGEAAK